MSELDGQYRITTVSSYGGPIEQKSDGITELRNGQTQRRDTHNVLWTSTFTVAGPEQVKMVSVADPTDADHTFALIRADGSPTRAPVTYEAMLRYSRKGDKIQLSGQIEYGKDTVILTMRRIGD